MVSLLSDIKPLKEYLNDKKEMVEVMFSCIEENQLKKMIPDVLKDAKMEDVKAECLVELLGMSKKRIMGILEGKELDESSEDSLELSDISDEDTSIKTEKQASEKSSKKKDSKEIKTKSSRKVRKATSSESDQDEQVPSKKKKTKKKSESPVKEVLPKKGKNQSSKKHNKGECSKETKEPEVSEATASGIELQPEKGGKNLLKILELEMRARAIRSLIKREEKKNKGPKTDDKKSSPLDLDDNDPDAVIIVDETADQIDLTKDESDSEQTKSKDEPKTTSLKVRNYRKNNEQSPDRFQPPTRKEAVEQESTKQTKTTSKEGLISNQAQSDKKSEDFVPQNWTERWLDSNDVKKVMQTTKVLTSFKKRLLNVSKQKSLEEKNNSEVINKTDTVIVGTVGEYSRLPSKITNKNINSQTEDSQTTEGVELTNSQSEVNNESAQQSSETETVITTADNNRDSETSVATIIGEDETNKITQDFENPQLTKDANEINETTESQVSDINESSGTLDETVEQLDTTSSQEDTQQPSTGETDKESNG